MSPGTHWVWELCSMLVNRTTEYDANPKESCMLEFHLPEQMESFRSPRILNSHLLPRQMPTKILTQRNKVIFLQRNPKDVAVSTYHHVTKLHDYKCSFSAFLKVFLNKGISLSTQTNNETSGQILLYTSIFIILEIVRWTESNGDSVS